MLIMFQINKTFIMVLPECVTWGQFFNLFNVNLTSFRLVGRNEGRKEGRKEENVLFNDTLNTFSYGYMASDIGKVPFR